MKHNHIFGFFFAAAAAATLAGCSDDLGNYIYTPVNEVDVAF